MALRKTTDAEDDSHPKDVRVIEDTGDICRHCGKPMSGGMHPMVTCNWCGKKQY